MQKKKREWKYGRGLDVWWVLTGLVKEECLWICYIIIIIMTMNMLLSELSFNNKKNSIFFFSLDVCFFNQVSRGCFISYSQFFFFFFQSHSFPIHQDVLLVRSHFVWSIRKWVRFALSGLVTFLSCPRELNSYQHCWQCGKDPYLFHNLWKMLLGVLCRRRSSLITSVHQLESTKLLLNTSFCFWMLVMLSSQCKTVKDLIFAKQL